MKTGIDTEKYDIVIVPAIPGFARRLKTLKGWQWAFIGINPCLRETLIKELGNENRFYYGSELQNISIEYKNMFLNWIANTAKTQQHPIWWASNMAYKNPLTSDFFLHFSQLLLINKWIDEGIKKLIIIIENPWLIKACSSNFSNKNVYIIHDIKYHARKSLMCNLTSLTKWFIYLIGVLALWTINKIFFQTHSKEAKKRLKKEIDVIICTWIEDRSFAGTDSIFSDPFLGSLNSFLLKREFNTVVLSLPFMKLHLLKKAYLSKKVIPGICIAGFKDILKSCSNINPIKKKGKIPKADQLDISDIFDYERISERWMVIHGYLHYIIVKNLFKKETIKCRSMIFPFENQPWDKMMVLAAKESKSGCKTIACHNITVPKFYLNFFLGKDEDKIHPQPDIIVANGKYWTSVLKSAGYSCPVENGGSLRYSLGGQNTENQSKSNDADNNVLVLLSNSLYYTLDLLFYLLRSYDKNKNYLLKPHPDTPEKTIRKHINAFPDNFRFVDGAMDKWMGKVSWAIHIGTTAAIECMINGIGVIKYVPERIDLDPLLGTDIQQFEVTDKYRFDFGQKVDFIYPDTSIIAEPFNEKTWNMIFSIP